MITPIIAGTLSAQPGHERTMTGTITVTCELLSRLVNAAAENLNAMGKAFPDWDAEVAKTQEWLDRQVAYDELWVTVQASKELLAEADPPC